MGEIILEHVTKIFGNGVIAVNDLDLTIKNGEFMVLLGPSGCGKTTILRLIAGLETPTKGKIYIDGKSMEDVPPQKRDVAMVFQSYALYPHMTVYENMALPLKIRKIPEAEIRKKVKEVAELLKIEELLHRKPRELSGGQRQRVALGRAIVREPKVFLMDEPLSNLDAKLRIQMRTELKILHKKLKTTTVYVTHDQEEAMTLAQRIAVINKGILQQVGSPTEIYEHPANLFTATFIGSPSMNTFEGILIEKNGELIFNSESFTYRLPKRMIQNCSAQENVVLGVRPEDIKVYKRNENAIEASVEVIEPVGREMYVAARIGNQRITIIVDSNIPIKVDETVWIKFDETRIHLFRQKDGKAIF